MSDNFKRKNLRQITPQNNVRILKMDVQVQTIIANINIVILPI